MIYFGVQLLPQAFKVVALSEGFAFINEHYFNIEEYDKIKPWIDSVKINPDESAKWFFDEKEFNNADYPGFVFESLDECNEIFLVNHRKLVNMMQFFYECIAQEYYFAPISRKRFLTGFSD
jgi:hypothetical protein